MKLTNNQIGRIQLVFQEFEEIKDRRNRHEPGDSEALVDKLLTLADEVCDWDDLTQISQGVLKSVYNVGGELVYHEEG